ncbi:MAG: GFA family protein [Rhodospirillales bacterium]|nr:GFA family protein [Rhodospirillales bacterium]
MTETKANEGGCQCGQIRYSVSGAPNNTTNCHCSQCRMAAGAPYVTWSEFPAEAVTFISERPQFYRSSDAAERGFCPACGTTLTFCYIDGNGIDIATATLDDPSIFPPQKHIWTRSKVAWVSINDGLPQYPKERDSD